MDFFEIVSFWRMSPREGKKKELDHSVQFSRSAYCTLAAALCSGAQGAWERSQWCRVRLEGAGQLGGKAGTAPSSPSSSCLFLFLGAALCQPVLCMEAWCSFLRLSTCSPGPTLGAVSRCVFTAVKPQLGGGHQYAGLTPLCWDAHGEVLTWHCVLSLVCSVRGF